MPFGSFGRSKVGFGNCTSTDRPSHSYHHPGHKMDISDGALVEVFNSNDEKVRFKIAFDIAQFTKSENPTGQLEALKLLYTVLETAGTACVAKNSINYAVRSSPIFSCDVLLISFDLVDAVVKVLQTSIPQQHDAEKETLLQCKSSALKLLNMIDGNFFETTSHGDLNEVQHAIVTRHPNLVNVLVEAGLNGELKNVHTDSALLLREMHTANPHRQQDHTSSVVQLLLDAIGLFDYEGEVDTRDDDDRRCTTAVEMFVSLSVSIEQQAVVGKMLPRFLSYVMEGKCSADKAATLADLLRAVDISMTSNVTVLEKVLMISCFHPDVTVQERYMDHLTSSAVACCCLAQKQEDGEALQWWTGRCLPTWIDVLTHGIAEGAEISSGSKHSNICHVLGQLMVNQSPLRADGINMPLFVVAMIDGGGHTKLMSIIEALPSGSAWKGELKSLYHKATVPENQFLSTDNIEKLRFVPWSWKNHSGFSHQERMAVCAVFTAPLYKHPKNGDVGPLPSEVAHEICSYLPIRRCKMPVKWFGVPKTSTGSTSGFGNVASGKMKKITNPPFSVATNFSAKPNCQSKEGTK